MWDKEKKERFLLLSTAVLVSGDFDEKGVEVEGERIYKLLDAAIHKALETEDTAKPYSGWTFDRPGEPDVNARKCDVCGQWTSDRSKPDFICTLNWGGEIDGEFICQGCVSERLTFAEMQAEGFTCGLQNKPNVEQD